MGRSARETDQFPASAIHSRPSSSVQRCLCGIAARNCSETRWPATGLSTSDYFWVGFARAPRLPWLSLFGPGRRGRRHPSSVRLGGRVSALLGAPRPFRIAWKAARLVPVLTGKPIASTNESGCASETCRAAGGLRFAPNICFNGVLAGNQYCEDAGQHCFARREATCHTRSGSKWARVTAVHLARPRRDIRGLE